MNKATLRRYRLLQKEIEKDDADIEKILKKREKIPVIAGKVQTSMEEFPYTRTSMTVDIYEPKEDEHLRRLLEQKELKRDKARDQLLAIEQFIASIDDSLERQIIELVFVDGLTYRDAGDELGYDFSVISRKIDEICARYNNNNKYNNK